MWRRRKFFVFLFVAAAIQHEPVGLRIADAVAEDGVQTKARLVDEIVHVALDRAVVVAEEDHPLPVIEKDPAGEMNRANAGQAAAGEDVAGARSSPSREDADGGQQAAPVPGFRLPIAVNWLVTSMILRAGQIVGVSRVHAGAQLGIGFLQLAEPQEDRTARGRSAAAGRRRKRSRERRSGGAGSSFASRAASRFFRKSEATGGSSRRSTKCLQFAHESRAAEDARNQRRWLVEVRFERVVGAPPLRGCGAPCGRASSRSSRWRDAMCCFIQRTRSVSRVKSVAAGKNVRNPDARDAGQFLEESCRRRHRYRRGRRDKADRCEAAKP